MANKLEISDQNFMEYLERLTAAVGHADRHEPLRVYLEGLLLPGERKSVEPMAARIDPTPCSVAAPVDAPLRGHLSLGPGRAHQGGPQLRPRGVPAPRRRR